MGNCQSGSQLQVTTWHKQTYNLFDYESQEVTEQFFDLATQDFKYSPESENQVISLQKSEGSIIAQFEMGVLQVRKTYALADTAAGNSANQPKKCWLSLQQRTPLKRGDIFRLGRVTFRIYDIMLSESVQSLANSQGGPDMCRICLRTSMPRNPLLNPCKCQGTLKYIHKDCLKRWIRDKHNLKCELYLWDDLKCEICKHKYKPIFHTDGQTHHFCELVRPDYERYMILEFQSKKSVGRCGIGDRFSSKSDGLYVVQLQDRVTLGRSKENDMKIKDVSISRCHSILTVQNNTVFIEDNKSKYGTLLLLQESFNLLENRNSTIQIGRSTFKLQQQAFC